MTTNPDLPGETVPQMVVLDHSARIIERDGDQNSDSRGRLKRGCWAGKNRRGRPRDSSSTTPMYLFARKKSGAVELLGPSTAQLSHQNYQKRKRTPPTPPARTASPPPTRRPQFSRERPSHLAEDHTRGRPRARRPGTSRSTPCARRRRGRDPELWLGGARVVGSCFPRAPLDELVRRESPT